MDINLNDGDVTELHSKITERTNGVRLTPTQKLRAKAAGEVFKSCRPSFTVEDEENIGMILTDLAGWAVWGADYNSGGVSE